MGKVVRSCRIERDKTDLSLKSERDKTNDVLENSTELIEQQVDLKIETTRQNADEDRDLNRSRIDRSTKTAAGTSSEIQSDINLGKERLQSDLARTKERSGEDRLRRKERMQKTLIAEALLASERKLTDTDLLEERAMIDSETIERADLLLAEQALHKISKDALATRNRYLAIVSHDLKNPLSSIAMSAGLICTAIKEEETNDAGEILKLALMIERNAAAMERMISHLLDVERIARDKLKLSYTRQDVRKFLEDCESLFSSVAGSKGVAMNCTSNGEPVFINCDYDRILQVLSNLIGNALKFTPHGGAINVTARDSGLFVEFAVRDTGSGIPAEAEKKIFEEFSQLQSTNRSGLGLGLYISKWLVEAHGGEIQVTSQMGVGSVFSFKLPKIPEDQQIPAIS